MLTQNGQVEEEHPAIRTPKITCASIEKIIVAKKLGSYKGGVDYRILSNFGTFAYILNI